jgi:hypothetical protein
MRILLAFLLMTGIAFAEPFLICDAPPADEAVTDYEIYQDGIKIGTSPAPLSYDLQGITPGKYTWTIKAINVWGSSEASDPYISPAPAGRPLGVGLE